MPSGQNYHFDEVKKVLPVNILQYVSSKSNRHTLLSGRSGTGKSTLAEWLTMRLPYQGQVVFSFKPDDTFWAQNGLSHTQAFSKRHRILSERRPSHFLEHFLIANPITSQGIASLVIRDRSQKIAERSSNWHQFLDLIEKEELDAKRRRDGDALAALSWINAQAQNFILEEQRTKGIAEYMAENRNMVLDFSGIKNEQAQSSIIEWPCAEKYSTDEGGVVLAFNRCA